VAAVADPAAIVLTEPARTRAREDRVGEPVDLDDHQAGLDRISGRDRFAIRLETRSPK
jgi:hypothetical protein